MIVYQTGHDGVFVDIVRADESPLEPGVFLIPGGCVVEEPPSYAPGQWARWTGSEWVVEDVPTGPADTPEEPPAAPEGTIPTISKAQGMMALYNAGLLGQLESLIANHPYPPVRIWFANANYWERSNPYIQSLGPEMGLTEEEIDALFEVAALLAS